MLEMWCVSTNTEVVSENISFSTKAPLILLMSAFLAKIQHFFGDNTTFIQSNSARAVLEIFQLCFLFLQEKRLLLMETMSPEFSFRIAPNWPQIGKMTMTSQFTDMTSSSNFFEVVLFLLSSSVTGLSSILISLLVLEI